jgi:hypothetical protein
MAGVESDAGGAGETRFKSAGRGDRQSTKSKRMGDACMARKGLARKILARAKKGNCGPK